jgi:hypothetical protein
VPQLLHSTEAANTLHLFHSVDAVVYVEGDDDVLFWGGYFRRVATSRAIKFVPVGGDGGLEAYVEKIVAENAEIIVASDRDYREFSGDLVTHPRILYTYGYSIENTLYCPENLAAIISKYERTLFKSSQVTDNWLNRFAETCKDLLVLDIACRVYNVGIEVMPDNCMRFLRNNRSDELSIERLQAYVEEIMERFEHLNLFVIEQSVSKSRLSLRFIVKGHFLTNAVINHIKRNCQRKSFVFGNENLYEAVIDGSEECFSVCEEWEHYKTSIEGALATIT